jgi:hypothetical protein
MVVETLPCADEVIETGLEVERRAEVRYLCDMQVIFYPLSAQQRLWARVRNISAKGIGLLLRAPIAAGTRLVIEMKTLDPSTSLTLIAQVVHCTMQQDQNWIVGCRFLSRPHEEDLLALL